MTKRKTPAVAAPTVEPPPMWVRILRTHDFTPRANRSTTWGLVKDEERSMRRVHAEEVIANGDAEEIPTPGRPEDPPPPS